MSFRSDRESIWDDLAPDVYESNLSFPHGCRHIHVQDATAYHQLKKTMPVSTNHNSMQNSLCYQLAAGVWAVCSREGKRGFVTVPGSCSQTHLSSTGCCMTLYGVRALPSSMTHPWPPPVLFGSRQSRLGKVSGCRMLSPRPQLHQLLSELPCSTMLSTLTHQASLQIVAGSR